MKEVRVDCVVFSIGGCGRLRSTADSHMVNAILVSVQGASFFFDQIEGQVHVAKSLEKARGFDGPLA